MRTRAYVCYNSDMDEKKEKFIGALSAFTDYLSKHLPDDILARLKEMSDSESVPHAKVMYSCMSENLRLADETDRPVCQDTGLVQFFVKIGMRFPLIDCLDECFREAVYRAYKSAPLRPNAVEYPSERNTLTDVGDGVPYTEFELVPDSDSADVTVYLAGGGAALPGKAAVFPPGAGFEGVARFVADAMVEKGVNACPPLVVGVGIAGCMATAAKLAKRAALREIPSSNPRSEIAEQERVLKKILDETAIGPQGAGGSASVMAVNIECACHHPSSLGVAVQFGCWAHRRGRIIFDGDLNAEVKSHGGFRI